MCTYRKRRYFRHTWKKICLRYVNFLLVLYAFEYGKKQSVFQAFCFSFTGKAKMPHKRQTRYALFMTTVLQLKELCGSDLLDLKLVLSTLKIKNRPSKSSTTDEDQIKTQIENNPRYTIRKLEMLNMSKSTIHKHFVKLGYINSFNVWILHDLTEKNLMDRISICDSLYKRNEETPFLKQVVMKNGSFTIMLSEKNLGESGMNHLQPKSRSSSKKIMLCV